MQLMQSHAANCYLLSVVNQKQSSALQAKTTAALQTTGAAAALQTIGAA